MLYCILSDPSYSETLLLAALLSLLMPINYKISSEIFSSLL